MTQPTDTRTDRQILEDLAARGSQGARVALSIRQSREAGLTRQKTADEILADMLAAQANPPAFVTHASGRTHVATFRHCGECA